MQTMLRTQARLFARQGANGLAFMLNKAANIIDNMSNGDYRLIEADALGDAGNEFDKMGKMIHSRAVAEILYKMAEDKKEDAIKRVSDGSIYNEIGNKDIDSKLDGLSDFGKEIDFPTKSGSIKLK